MRPGGYLAFGQAIAGGMTAARPGCFDGPMPIIPRRVVTGHDDNGVSVFTGDGPVPVVRTAPDGATFYEIWGTDAAPAPIDARAADPALDALTVPPAPNGTKIRINEFPPGVASPVHRTQSVDYGIVLSGEVVLVLDDSETVLRAGDIVVQRGTSHRWENRSPATARMAFILIDGVFTTELLDSLGTDVLGGLLHDPMRPAPGRAGVPDEGSA
jgi:quercetin dioxygenase-like cupin family protein